MQLQPSVTIVDYGMGNIHSLASALTYLGAQVEVSSEPSQISESCALFLPGVGSFPAAMSVIRRKGIDQAIGVALEKAGSKLLGICLGMQLLGRSSTEDGGGDGLGLLDFKVQQFLAAREQSLSIPHIGFGTVNHNPRSRLFAGMGPSADYYFVHEFQCLPGASGGLESHSEYGDIFIAGVEKGKVFGTQFHPEKSQTNGLRVLKNFLEIRT